VSGTPYWTTVSHRRLAIIDPSPAGHQPMCNEDGSIWIIFNGEVYNFQELRPQLLAAGHRFRSKTDTEVVIHGYEEWGNDLVKRLRGMFAFAIWDGPQKRMLIARDRVGKKPLFYFCDGQKLVFASEIKAILASGAVQAEVDPTSLHDYLTYLYFPTPRTAYKNIFKLPPATCMSVEVLPIGLQSCTWQYWDPVECCGVSAGTSETDLVDRARSLIEEAVRIRLVSDVPLGVFLSGGIDSSTITALASRTCPGQLQTFSIGFRGSEAYNELPFANMVAERFETDHHVLHADAHCVESLTEVVRHFDEPFGNPTAILQLILSKLMRQHVTVAISGDGGDEAFAGYPRYSGAQIARYCRRLPDCVTGRLVSRLSALIRDDTTGRHTFRRLRQFTESAWQAEEEMYLRWVGYFSEEEKQTLYTPSFRSKVKGHDSGDFLRDLFRRGATLDALNRLGYVDLASFLACNCLEYSDRMSMANSLEVRCPFTDHELVEFALHLQPSLKLRYFDSKWILKRAMRGILPEPVLRKKKMGFNPPAPQWINGELKPLIAQFLAPQVIERRGMFCPDVVSRLIREHAERRRDNTLKIWGLLMIELWQRLYFDREPESSVRESVLAITRNTSVRRAIGTGLQCGPKAEVDHHASPKPAKTKPSPDKAA
jgi:asparagine synthase (glutamine-hydrolysing)